MATSTTTKEAVSLKLANGTTETGAMKTVSLSIGRLSTSGYSDDAAMAIALALVPVLNLSLASVDHVRTSTLED